MVLLLVLAGAGTAWSAHRAAPAPPALVAETAAAPTTTTPAPPSAGPAAAPAPVPVAVPVVPPAPPSACEAGTDPVVVAAGPAAAVSICTGPDGLTYHGTRASDGASTTLPATQVGSTWVAESGTVAYRVGDGELLLTEGGAVLETQVLDAWWAPGVPVG